LKKPPDEGGFFGMAGTDFETHFEDFELFWYSKPVKTLRDYGLLVLYHYAIKNPNPRPYKFPMGIDSN
jgi:hypothetical protein